MEYGVKVHGRTSTSIVLSTHGKGNRFKVQILFILLYCEVVAVVARRAHNPKVGGSNPSLATLIKLVIKRPSDCDARLD